MNLAERVHDAHGGARRVRVLGHHFASLLPRNATVLDVGCGDGSLGLAIRQERSDLTLSGIDVLVRPDAGIPVSEYDGETLPFPDDAFDAVVFSDVLHHCESPESLLAEAVRVARTCLVIKDHTLQGPLSGRVLRFMDDVGNRRFGVALPHNYWPEDRWRATFLGLGLDCAAWISELRLYPPPLDWVFGRGLHFVAKLSLP